MDPPSRCLLSVGHLSSWAAVVLLTACSRGPDTPAGTTPEPAPVAPLPSEPASAAPEPLVEDGTWEGLEAHRRAVTLLRGCPELEIYLPAEEDLAEGTWVHVTARLREGELLVESGSSGNGVDGGHGFDRSLVRLADCRHLEASAGWGDGELFASASVDAAATPDQVATLLAPVARPTAPPHGYARLVLTATEARTFLGMPDGPDARSDLLALTMAAQPWLPGRPVEPEASYWSRGALASIGAGELHFEEAPRATGAYVRAQGTPRRVRSVAGLELYEAPLDGRNAGVAIALYDPSRDRHRWIAVTRGHVNGTTVEWLADGDGLLLGWAESRHPVYAERDGLLVIDLRGGRAYRLNVRGVHSRPASSPVPLSELRRRIDAL